jgi:hypothetical protein
MNDRNLDRLVRRVTIKFGITLVIVFGRFFAAMHLWPPAYGEPFDWDRYHARQDACLEKDRIIAACVQGYCDELALAASSARLLAVRPITRAHPGGGGGCSARNPRPLRRFETKAAD